MLGSIVNVDDVGMDKNSNIRIIELAKLGKVNSFSCFTDGDPVRMEELTGISDIRIGLHLDLTEFQGSGLVSLFKDLVMKRLDHEMIEQEICRQIDKFVEIYGHFPHHIDSHQHVHQIPFLRQTFLKSLVRYNSRISGDFYIRCTDVPFFFIFSKLIFFDQRSLIKNILLKLLGISFKKTASNYGFKTNRFLLGSYSFNSSKKYVDFFNIFNQFKQSDFDVFYCHPGGSTFKGDLISDNRVVEYETLMRS